MSCKREELKRQDGDEPEEWDEPEEREDPEDGDEPEGPDKPGNLLPVPRSHPEVRFNEA